MQAFFSTSDQVLYGLLNVFLSSMVVNYVTVMGERKVQLLVISDKYEEIPERTSDGMDLGVTLVMWRQVICARNRWQCSV